MKLIRCLLWLTFCSCSLACSTRDFTVPEDADASVAVHAPKPLHLPHNIIVLMGDGMGAEQLATGRYLRNGRLRVDSMHGPAWVNTDSLTTKHAEVPDDNPTDSAAAATAFATGVLVENGVVSLTVDGKPLLTTLEAAQDAGKATGIVTTSYFFDASPAGFTAHAPSRGDYADIIHQMLTVTRPDVIMGAGGSFVDDPAVGVADDVHTGGYLRVDDIAQLQAWDPKAHPRLLGLFSTDFVPVATASELFSMTPELERTDKTTDPRLITMTMRAIDRLSRDPDGFFLFAEDELFDEMGHRGPSETEWTNRAYGPQAVAFDNAVGAVLDWVKEYSSFEETLVMVFADHETGGYHFDHGKGPSSGEFTAYEQLDGYRYGHHTRTLIPAYALGPGSESLDLVRSHLGSHALMTGTLKSPL